MSSSRITQTESYRDSTGTVGALEEMTRAPRKGPNDLQFGTAGTTMTMPDGRVIQFPAMPFEARGRGEPPPKKPPV